MAENVISDNKVLKLPDSAYYLPNFITSHEEAQLLEKIYSSPKPKWKTLSNRRLQNWGGLPHPKGMIQETLPEWLMNYVKKVGNLGIFQDKLPNHVLINEYLPGQGIMPHEDGPLFYPTIATINLGSHTVLDYYEKPSNSENLDSEMQLKTSRYIGSLLLERCSLLLVQDDLYSKYLHGIKETTVDILDDNIKNFNLCSIQNETELCRQSRISLTIRHVPHTVKANFIFGMK
ncbi:alpha-ketoglutarate-dependent dioxygenase alkB homolog 6 [Trichonephila clavata]|uniref:Alpha-ketoglutarate-dependent dioxygenase alkB homolog 6 n=1 Tax=Trichonephila clavata TaxID=2740835 RepID=A0A8X6KP59_TRICU|nr:alpha-ketoglutarate-dependent dioxygenase alkB homolog 6 [Trichonephila clavata]